MTCYDIFFNNLKRIKFDISHVGTPRDFRTPDWLGTAALNQSNQIVSDLRKEIFQKCWENAFSFFSRQIHWFENHSVLFGGQSNKILQH